MPDPRIGNRQYPFVGIERYATVKSPSSPFEFGPSMRALSTSGWLPVPFENQLAQKNFMIGIEKFLIIGKIFSVVTPIFLFCIAFIVLNSIRFYEQNRIN